MRAKTLALATFVVLLVEQTCLAQSQEERAAELDRAARAAFQAGDYRAAARDFDEANRLAPFPELRYNAALAWDRAGEHARAADAYEGALQQGGLDANREKQAKSNLAKLKSRLGYVRIVSPVGGTASVAHRERVPIPVNVHLTPGEHEIVIEQPGGGRTKKSLSVRAGEVSELNVEAEAAGPVSEPKRLDPSPAPTPPLRGDTGPKAEPSSSSKSTWGFVLVGAGAVFAGAATYFGIQTLKAREDYDDSNQTDGDIRERGVRNRALTNVAIAASAICAGAGVYLLISADGKPVAGARLRF